MRVLFTCVVGYGHFHPMVPLALAMRDAGDAVAFATDPSFCPYVASVGFEAFPAGLDQPEAMRRFLATQERWDEVPPDEKPRHMFPGMFAGARVRPMLADLVPLLRDWKPDLLVHDTNEMAGAIAAEVVGVRHAEHSFGILRPLALTRAAAAVVEPIAHEHGVPNPGIGGNGGELYLDICPPSLQIPDIAGIPNARPLRPVGFDGIADAPLPRWLDDLPDRPTVYVTLGTVFNQSRDVFSAVLDGLRAEPLNVIVTVGGNGDPNAFGPQPENVHIERYIPQSRLLPRCDVLVSHGGSGATLGALQAAVPMLALPQGADQFVNAQQMVQAGAGLRLVPAELTPDAVREGVRRLLDEPSFAEGATRVRDEIEAMPPPAELVPVLEGLAAGHTRA
jgi:UDP:flavonoid glycosyltransferase YjiC (YdhE family)